MIENLNLATNKELLPGIELPESDTYYLSPEEYNTLVLKIKELIDSHNSLASTVSGNISFMSIVFRRTNDEVVSKPTGGTYDSPVPTSLPEWTDGIPSGTATLWASTRIFSSDGLSPQQSEWTEPSKMTDTSEFDVEFSSLEYVDENTPGNPTDNPDNWSDIGNESTIWMATVTIKNGQLPLGSDWTIIRIKGENGVDGKDQEFIYTTRATPDEPYDISTLPAVQTAEYLPNITYGIWTDDPQGVIVTKQFEWVSKRTRINGIWGKFSKPALWARYAIDGDGQSSFKSFVFKRSNIPLTEAPPAGAGSFTNPYPDPNDGWTDYIPSGSETIWVSTRMFSKDGFAPQEDSWSIPTILADSADLDVEFSKEIVPGNPTDNPANWSNDADEETIWMAIAKLKGGVIDGGWKISKIKGEGGTGLSVGTVYLYKRSATMPTDVLPDLTYTFATGLLSGGDLQGWTQEIPANDSNPIWIMFATIASLNLTDIITSSEWSNPVILTQDGGKSANVFLYQRSDTTPDPATPTTTCEYFFDTHTLTGTLGSWQISVPETNGQPLWMIAATAYSSTASDIIDIDDWSDPITLLKDGDDGPGYESIFILTNDSTPPQTPTSEQIDDYIPVGWSDNPLAVSSTNKYCWICKRSKKTNIQTGLKEWGPFSSPIVFLKWVTDGKLVYSGSGMVYYALPSEYAPTAPTATSFTFVPPTINGLSANWQVGAPTYQAGQTNAYWYCTYSATDLDGDGIGTVSFGPVTKAINFTGLVTFTSAGVISDGLSTIDFTSIDGSQIKTGTITSTNYLVGSGDGFSSVGSYINLSNGSFVSKNFKIDSDGNAAFKGTITGSTIIGSTIQTAIEGSRMVLGSNLVEYGTGHYLKWFRYAESTPVMSLGLLIYDGDLFPSLSMTTELGNGKRIIINPHNIIISNLDNSLQSIITKDSISSSAFYQTSDERYKNDINYISDLSIHKYINFKQFTLNSDQTGRLRYGVIAQDLEYTCPWLVITDNNGYKSVDYNSLYSLKLAGIEFDITELKEKIKQDTWDLQNRLYYLESRLQLLESKL